MRVYEAKLVYEATLFEVANLALNKPELVYDYMKDVLEVHPMQEAFYVTPLALASTSQSSRSTKRDEGTPGT